METIPENRQYILLKITHSLADALANLFKPEEIEKIFYRISEVFISAINYSLKIKLLVPIITKFTRNEQVACSIQVVGSIVN
jgi:hypothetical protein